MLALVACCVCTIIWRKSDTCFQYGRPGFSKLCCLFLGTDEFNTCDNLVFATIKGVSIFYDAALSVMSQTVSPEVCITACALWKTLTSSAPPLQKKYIWWMHLILNCSFCVTCRNFPIEMGEINRIYSTSQCILNDRENIFKL